MGNVYLAAGQVWATEAPRGSMRKIHGVEGGDVLFTEPSIALKSRVIQRVSRDKFMAWIDRNHAYRPIGMQAAAGSAEDGGGSGAQKPSEAPERAEEAPKPRSIRLHKRVSVSLRRPEPG